MDNDEIKNAFLNLKSRDDVANILGIKERSLRYFLFKRRPENMYTTFTLSKRNGTKRVISAPQRELKAIQRKLADVLSCVYTPKVCAYGFVPGKSIVGNALQHTKRNLVLNIDLKDFFTQIHFGRVRGMLMKPPYSIGKEAATTIAQIACVNGVLPQGAPSSPIITNMICAPLDNSMMQLAKSADCVYTRYADDITLSTFKKSFSTDIVFVDEGRMCVGTKIEKIMEKHNFLINPEKVVLRSNSVHQEVTGLTVNVIPNLRRDYIRNLRAILHNCCKKGIYDAAKTYARKGYCGNPVILSVIDDPEKQEMVESWFISVLKGKINYIKQVKGEKSLTFLSFAQQLNGLTNKIIFDVSGLNRLEVIAEKNTYILESDEGDTYYQGSAFFIQEVGLITSYHVVKSGDFFKAYTYRNYPTKSADVVGLELKLVSADEGIDYAIFNTAISVEDEYAIKVGDSSKLRVGEQVTIIGYPNHQEGNSPFIQNCAITSKKLFLETPFFTVSGRIVHGASGGVVLNSDYEAIGIIKGGIPSLAEEDENENQGFVPLHMAIEHMRAGQSTL